MQIRRALILASGLALAGGFASDASAADPYVVLEDPEGVVAMDSDQPAIGIWRKKILEAYATTGFALPEVLSIWTAFPQGGNNFATYIHPQSNDVEGIGIPLDDPTTPPLRALLWHNNVLAMEARAGLHDAPVEGYGRYLFLLEISHLWGPALEVPDPNPQELIGFPYHWSFFNDQPSPAGGNTWTDNGDGTFTVVAGDPATLRFSMLDLYIMGLASPNEVPPFGVLTNVTVPAMPTDPFWGGPYSDQSFPWFDGTAAPLTVTATRRELTIDDVIAANGTRTPAAGTKTSWTIGFVLLVPQGADAATIAEAKAAFDPIAQSLAPGFSDATMGRGTLEVLTVVEEGAGGGAGGGPATSGAGGGGSGDGGADDDGGGCDCRTSAGAARGGVAAWLALAAIAFASRRRLR